MYEASHSGYQHRNGNGTMNSHSREQLFDDPRYTSTTEQRKTVHQYTTRDYTIESQPAAASPSGGNGYGYVDSYGYGENGGEGYSVANYSNGYADEDDGADRDAVGGYSLSARVVTVGGGGVYDSNPALLSPGAASAGNRSYRSGAGSGLYEQSQSYQRTAQQLRYNGDAASEDDPYANLPGGQPPQSKRLIGSNLSLSSGGGIVGVSTPYSNGIGSRGSGIERYSSSEFNQQHQPNREQQHEYVNYTDPDVMAVRQSLESARIVSSRTSSFGRDLGGGSGGYLPGSLSGSRQRIVAYEPEPPDTGSQGFGNLGYTSGQLDDEAGDFYPISASAAAAAASTNATVNYQSHLSVGSAAAAAAPANQSLSNAASASQVHLQQVRTAETSMTTRETTTRSQAQQQMVTDQAGVNYRNPELPDIIEYLRTGSETTKCHAAAYLQHLTFCEEEVKSRVRAAGGIPLLVRLLSTGESSGPELHKNVLGALRNLSYGQKQEENKREMCKPGVLQEARRLLETSPDQDVKELATAVMWNISVSQTLKKDVLDTCLDTLVQRVILPHAGLERRGEVYTNVQREIYWTVLFRNATGVVRSVSSCGDYARRRLRSADGLVESLRQIIQCAVDNSDLDGKAVENCVCTLRNLVFACQEVEDPAYLRRHAARAAGKGGGGGGGGGGNTGLGCFGRNSSRAAGSSRGASGKAGSNAGAPTIIQRRLNGPPRGMDLLWQLDIVPLLLPIVADCTNPETLEAAAGALQNLAACDWQPSVDIRAHVRKERGLPLLVELLGLDADKVVQTAATALRNLAQDERNKDLIGKYALEALTSRLPGTPTAQGGAPPPSSAATSAETYAAVIATLYTVLKDNFEFSRHFLELGGVRQLMESARDAAGRYGQKVSEFSWTLLAALWRIRELQPLLRQAGWTEAQFVPPKRAGKSSQPMGGPGMSQSGPGARQDSMPKSRLVARQPQQQQQQQQQGFENSAYTGEQQQVPLRSLEPTYAQVDKDRKAQQRAQQLDAAPAVDSWV